MRLLLVEDDPMIGEAVRDGLKLDGYTVDWVRDGVAADAAIAVGDFAAVLLDLGLPRRDGLQVLKTLRARRGAVPVLVITARDAVADRIAGLDAGADDYLVKPFDLDELGARLRALLRRAAGRPQPIVEHGPVTIDPATREVTVHGRPVAVSAKEYALLVALTERPGIVLSRSQLEDRLYGWGEEVGSNAVEVHVHHLRRKLGDDVIRTVRGMGYTIALDGGA
ncbi:MAG: response regulator transcription factor [Burkholderiaceae bacterium]|jgi:DNA-binding response OmpR family regulator|nr:response regulator transcription factor [Burkholderiaceae bacterium]